MKTKATGFKQLKDGSWMIDTKVKVGNEYHHLGKKGYPTLSLAKADLENQKKLFIEKYNLSNNIISYNDNNIETTFDDIIKEYKIMRKNTVNISTCGTDESIYNVNLLPYFKGKDIKDVFTQGSIEQWHKDLCSNPKESNNKKVKAISKMKDILKFAYIHKYIDAPTYQDCDVILYQVKYSKKAKTERVVWTQVEEELFFDAITEDYNDNIMFKTFLICATRLGEFLGLQVNCFDYDKRRITIKQQAMNLAHKGIVITDRLKSNESYRNIVIPQELCDELKEYIANNKLKDDDFLFYSCSGKYIPLSRTTFRRKLKYYCDKAGVRECNPHAIRHQQAVKLASVSSTAQMIEISAHRLGHTPSVFLNTYANHKTDEEQEILLKKIYS